MASRRRKRVTDDINRFVELTMRRLQLRVYQALTLATPVKTGFGRAGWSPSTGSPSPGPSDRPDEDDVARSQAGQLFGENKKAAEALAASYKLSQGPIFIVNNVLYLVFLNLGTSAQAPEMFVEQAIADGVAATRRELS